MEKITLTDLTDIEKKMLDKALISRNNGYAPYSDFKVGASLLSEKGNIYLGCNVESVDFTLTTHAEMNAIDAMITKGERKIKKILITMKADSGYGMPCGLCRQKMLEFALKDMEIIGVNLDKQDKIRDIYRTTIEEILPYPFGPEHLKKSEKK